MGLRITTNVASLNAMKNLYGTRRNLETSLARLSSGYRINQAADDAAGLAISESLKGQIRGLYQANRNSQRWSFLSSSSRRWLKRSIKYTYTIKRISHPSIFGYDR